MDRETELVSGKGGGGKALCHIAFNDITATVASAGWNGMERPAAKKRNLPIRCCVEKMGLFSYRRRPSVSSDNSERSVAKRVCWGRRRRYARVRLVDGLLIELHFNEVFFFLYFCYN